VDERTTNGTTLKQQLSFLVNPRLEGYNTHIPHNIWLLCGDPGLVTVVPTVQAQLSAKTGSTDVTPAWDTGECEWSKIVSVLENFIDEASSQLSDAGAVPATAFIDRNPSTTFRCAPHHWLSVSM
jgi:hypothetical protein